MSSAHATPTPIAVLTWEQVQQIARDAYEAGARAAAPKKMLWTAKEAVQLTGFSESTIRAVGHENPEVMIKRGRAVRFDPEGLRRALAMTEKSKIKRR